MLFRSHLWGVTYPLRFMDTFWVSEARLILPEQLHNIITIKVSIERGWHARVSLMKCPSMCIKQATQFFTGFLNILIAEI
jgi:hypothetical protein